MAIGSACEVETQLDLSLDLSFTPSDEHRRLLQELGEIKAMLRGLERSLLG
jgi:four helix bundle protein